MAIESHNVSLNSLDPQLVEVRVWSRKNFEITRGAEILRP